MRDARISSPLLPSRPPRTGSGGNKNGRGANSRSNRDCNASKGSFGLKQSKKTPSSNESTATPSSVHLPTAPSSSPAYGLTRDLSDLSGSYYNGRPNQNAAASPVWVAADPGRWRHAQVLSSPRLPQHPQPHTDDESSVGLRGPYHHATAASRAVNSAIVDRGEVIEVCIHDTAAASVDDTTQNSSHCAGRTPLILLLMDPNRKLYELLQLWMDSSADTVRDILHTVNRNLDTNHHHHGGGPTWKQDYDGLFQVRNNHFSQLIHVLQAGKYEVVQGEVWVGKPWSMSAKQTVSYASTCLNHLKEIGVLQYRRCSEFAPAWRQFALRSTGSGKRLDDTVLVLSKLAAQRVYVPTGILKHHHACQFLAFVPPFEAASTPEMCVDVLTSDCAVSTASGLSDSHCGSADDVAVGAGDLVGPQQLGHYDEDDEDGEKRHRLQEHPDFCNKSETEESTYSTAGSQSPIVQSKSSSRDAASTTSAVTKESAYVLRTHAIHHVLPSSLGAAHRDPPPARGIVRLLSVLNCAKQQQQQQQTQHHLHQQFFGVSSSAIKSPSSSSSSDLYHRRSGMTAATTRTPLSDDTSTVTFPTHAPQASRSLYPLWEEDGASQSSGAPLLFSPVKEGSSANWMAHHVK
jgi:hypothetical protein